MKAVMSVRLLCLLALAGCSTLRPSQDLSVPGQQTWDLEGGSGSHATVAAREVDCASTPTVLASDNTLRTDGYVMGQPVDHPTNVIDITLKLCAYAKQPGATVGGKLVWENARGGAVASVPFSASTVGSKPMEIKLAAAPHWNLDTGDRVSFYMSGQNAKVVNVSAQAFTSSSVD
jgi:hypothetical protein